MCNSDFVNLHCHSTYSNLDGYSLPKDMVRRTKELGQTAIAVTDHGNIASVIDMKLACEDEGLKFIPGIEFYISPFGKDVSWRRDDNQRRGTSFHLLAWAYTQQGYKNLLKLVELSNKMGYYYNPRIDYDMLQQYNEGLIITSGCMASEVCQSLNTETGVTAQSYKTVNSIFSWGIEVFGSDRYFIEIQDHDIPALREINVELSRVNKHYDLPYVVTNDSHYAYPDQWRGQADLLCVNARCSRVDPNKFVQQFISHPDYFISSFEDMKAKNYGFNVPDSAFSNTVAITDMIEPILLGYEPEVKQYRFPIMPEYAHDYDQELERAAMRGFWKRYSNHGDDTPIKRLDHELDIIKKLGFASYFLCVYDLANYCVDKGIPMSVRGSAGGSIVLYCLHITDFCPLEYDLLFERFLNPDRVSAPDADIDVSPNRRVEVIKYIENKYGEEFVAQVCSFGYYHGKGAVRDAARIMELPIEIGEVFSSRLDGLNDLNGVTDPDSLNYKPHLIQTKQDKDLLDVALGLQGQIKSIGMHGGAVLLSNRPLREDYPLVRPKTSSKAVTKLLVGFNYETAEMLGGIKLDILGVEAIGIIDYAIELVNHRHQKSYTFENIPIDDPASFEIMNDGKLEEIFQLSGYSAQPVVKQIKPKNVRDVMVCNSICRPGPAKYAQVYADRMHGIEEIKYSHPTLESVLNKTFGIMLFQEDIMRVSQVVAKFTPTQADILRKACSKKKGFDKIKNEFIKGALANDYSAEFIENLWEDMLEFAGYGFNAAHSCSYALTAIKMAYLKAKYPIEFYASALTGRIGKDAKFSDLAKEMLKTGIKMLPPQIGISLPNEFAIDDKANAVRFPYNAVKNVGKKSSNLVGIGEITYISDLTNEQLKLFKKTGTQALESLALVGALDFLFTDRNTAIKAASYLGRGLMPAAQASYIEEDSYTQSELYAIERQLTGLYLSGHPLDGINVKHPSYSNLVFYEMMDGEYGVFVGVVKSIRTHRDKSGNLMAFVTIEDRDYAEMSVVVFASLYQRLSDRICTGCVIRVMGSVSVRQSKNEEEESKLKKYGRVSILAQNII